jgi:hypothetical protein
MRSKVIKLLLILIFKFPEIELENKIFYVNINKNILKKTDIFNLF